MRTRKTTNLLLSAAGIVAAVAVCSAPSVGATFAGSLCYDHDQPIGEGRGLFVGTDPVKTGKPITGWSTGHVSITWTVSTVARENVPVAIQGQQCLWWLYQYTLQVKDAKGDFSLADFEVSGNFDVGKNLYAPDTVAEVYEPGPGQSNVGMAPLDPKGNTFLKFSAPDEAGTLWNLSFYSNRVPVWGDFYMKDGKAGNEYNYAYNADFSLADPDVTASNTLAGWNILRPDGMELQIPPPPPVVPEPLTAGSIFLCIGGIGAYVRKRTQLVQAKR